MILLLLSALLISAGCGDGGADAGDDDAVDADGGNTTGQTTPQPPTEPQKPVVTITTREQEVAFNHARRKVRDVAVTDETVILDANEDPHGLYEAIHDKPDVATLSIEAEKVIVRSPLRLPQTQVTIDAKQLVFEDADEAAPAVIDVTPISLTKDAGQAGNGHGNNGAHGIHGPAMTLLIDEVLAPDQRKRFIVRGGDGQDAGDGAAGSRDGVDTVSIQIWKVSKRFLGVPTEYSHDKTIRVVGLRHHFAGIHHGKHDKGNTSSKFDPSSTPNKPSGVPGNASNGGALRASLGIVNELADLSPGKPGAPGRSFGKISSVSWSIVDGTWNAEIKKYTGYTTKYSGSTPERRAEPAPQPRIRQGEPGQFVKITRTKH